MAPAESGKTPCVDRRLLELLDEFITTFAERAASVWSSDFRPDLAPLILIGSSGDSHGYALNVDDTSWLGPAEEVSGPWSGQPSRRLVRFGPDGVDAVALEGQAARLDLEVDGRPCVALSYAALDDPGAANDFLRFVVHETFHVFQIFQQRWKLPFGHDPAIPLTTDRVDRRLAALEVVHLDAAVGTRDFAQMLRSASAFLEVRRRRQQRRPDLAPLELGYEQIEGSARFVENRYAALNGRLWWIDEVHHDSLHERDMARYYTTGSQQAQILDMIAPDWRTTIRDGAAPSDILERAIRHSADNDPPSRTTAA